MPRRSRCIHIFLKQEPFSPRMTLGVPRIAMPRRGGIGPRSRETVLLVYHDDKSVDRISVSPPSHLEPEDTTTMKTLLAAMGVHDVLKVKIDDGKFFGGQDLVDWLCVRLREEAFFGAAVRNELEQERANSNKAFDRLAESERNLKKRLQQKELEVEEAGKRRLEDLSEALRKQQNLRSKVEEDQEDAGREIHRLREEVSSLRERISIQDNTLATLEGECEALRSTVNTGRNVQEIDDAELREQLRDTLTRVDEVMRLKRRLYALEVDKNECSSRLDRTQREAAHFRATLSMREMSPPLDASRGSVTKATGTPAGARWQWNSGGRDQVLPPLSKYDISCGSTERPKTIWASRI
ncbi:unnamed protein product [Ascophyllum nodosum]